MNPLMSSSRSFFYCREAAGHPVDEQVATMTRAGFYVDPENLVLEECAPGEPVSRRPQFSRLLKLLREGDCLVVGELDALGRSAVEIRQMVGRCAQAGVRLYCAALGKCELTADAGKQVRDVLAAVAAIEREQLAARFRTGASRSGTLRSARGLLPSAAVRAEIASRVAAGVPLAQLAREYRLQRQTIIRICAARVESDDERLLAVPAREATRHTIEAVAMLAGDENRRR